MKNLAAFLSSRRKDKSRSKQSLPDLFEGHRSTSPDLASPCSSPPRARSGLTPSEFNQTGLARTVEPSRLGRSSLPSPTLTRRQFFRSVTDVAGAQPLPQPLSERHAERQITTGATTASELEHTTSSDVLGESRRCLSYGNGPQQGPNVSTTRQRATSLGNPLKPTACPTHLLGPLPAVPRLPEFLPTQVIDNTGQASTYHLSSSGMSHSVTSGVGMPLGSILTHTGITQLPLRLGPESPPARKESPPPRLSAGKRTVPELERTWERFLNEVQEDAQILSRKSSSNLSTLPSTSSIKRQPTQPKTASISLGQKSGHFSHCTTSFSSMSLVPFITSQVDACCGILTPPTSPVDEAHKQSPLESMLSVVVDGPDAAGCHTDGQRTQMLSTSATMNSTSSLPYLQSTPSRARIDSSHSSICVSGSVYSTTASELSLSLFPVPPSHSAQETAEECVIAKDGSGIGGLSPGALQPTLLTPPVTPDKLTFGSDSEAAKFSFIPSSNALPSPIKNNGFGIIEANHPGAHSECSTEDTSISSGSTWSSSEYDQESSVNSTVSDSEEWAGLLANRSTGMPISFRHEKLAIETPQIPSLPELGFMTASTHTYSTRSRLSQVRHQRLLNLAGAAEITNSTLPRDAQFSTPPSPRLGGIEWGQAI